MRSPKVIHAGTGNKNFFIWLKFDLILRIFYTNWYLGEGVTFINCYYLCISLLLLTKGIIYKWLFSSETLLSLGCMIIYCFEFILLRYSVMYSPIVKFECCQVSTISHPTITLAWLLLTGETFALHAHIIYANFTI